MSDSNAKTPGQEALSPAIEPMGKATGQAAGEATKDRFLPFLEGRVSGPGRRGTATTRGRPSPRPARSTPARQGMGRAHSRRGP